MLSTTIYECPLATHTGPSNHAFLVSEAARTISWGVRVRASLRHLDAQAATSHGGGASVGLRRLSTSALLQVRGGGGGGRSGRGGRGALRPAGLRGLRQCLVHLETQVPCLLHHASRLNLSSARAEAAAAPRGKGGGRRRGAPATLEQLMLEKVPSRQWEEGFRRMRAISFSAAAPTTGRWATYTTAPEQERPAYADAPLARHDASRASAST